MFDLSVPEGLCKTQVWFGSIISRPVDDDNQMEMVSPSGRPMEEEAAEYISPSPTLKSFERIQIYNQQYWWRLLNTLQETFPLLTRLFGYHDFNQTLGFPYLSKYPPHHWSLNFLSDRFLLWLEETYTAADRELVCYSAQIDSAFTTSFLCSQDGSLLQSNENQGDISAYFDKSLTLQPHVKLFAFPYDLFLFRTELLKQSPEHWLDHDFPSLVHAKDGESFYFLLFRNRDHDLIVDKISCGEYQLLSQFATGSSVESICEWLTLQPTNSVVACQAAEKLHLWFQRWVAFNILTFQKF